jgi:hypothetical protein
LRVREAQKLEKYSHQEARKSRLTAQ